MGRVEYPRVCLIGAGSSGITVLKALKDRGIPADCFEKSDQVGGNWVFKNPNGMSSAYRSLHINTSRTRMQYADYAMPADYPDFPHHSHIAQYFNDYVDHFGLRPMITFGTAVQRAERRADGLWAVTLDDGTVRHYDALLIANGHHWDPRWPEPHFPGKFDGMEMHSHFYIDPEEPHDLRGKNVVVVGMGNSAMDIAVELGRPGVANQVFLSARRGAYVIPNYLFGRPLDTLGALHPLIPFPVQRALLAFIHRLAVGKMEDYGLPEPDHKIGHAHPTVSSEVLVKCGRGDVKPKPGIAELCGKQVKFVDGSLEDIDAIIYCTGYKVSFPFFDENFLAARDNDLPLYRRLFHPDIENVFFFGLCQPLGAVMPIAEAQGKLIAKLLTGAYLPPSRDEMRADMAREREAMFRRYVPSKRHTMQVDYDLYLYRLAKEAARGRRRAARQGYRLPIPARAQAASEPASRRGAATVIA